MAEDRYHRMGMKRIRMLLTIGVMTSLLLIACGGSAADQTASDRGFEAVDVLGDGGKVMVSGNIETTPVADAQTLEWPEDAPEGFYEALEMGLVMNGYRDVEGLHRVMEYYFDNIGSPGFDAMIEHEMFGDIDADVQADLELLVRGIDIEVYRVGFIPGDVTVDGSGSGMNLGNIFGNDEEDPESALSDPSGIIPSGVALAGHLVKSTLDVGISSSVMTDTYSDGSKLYFFRNYNVEAGTTSYQTITTDGHGNIHFNGVVVRDGDGNIIESRVVSDNGGTTEAEADRTAERDERQQQDADAGNGGGSGGSMPAEDSGEGGICFLFVASCYNAWRELQGGASGAVGTGYVLINPGQADEQPESTYLSFDPQDLVINPSGEIAGSASGTNRAAQFALPVIVLPPRP